MIKRPPQKIPDQDLAGRVRRARERSGLTLQQVAERMGVNASTVHKYETGKARVTTSTLKQLSSILGASLLDLLPAPVATAMRADRLDADAVALAIITVLRMVNEADTKLDMTPEEVAAMVDHIARHAERQDDASVNARGMRAAVQMLVSYIKGQRQNNTSG